VTKPARLDATIVTVAASATASVGTPDGSGTLTVEPAGSGAPVRLSNARSGSIVTNRPPVAFATGVNQPVTSTTIEAPADENTSIAPSLPMETIAPFARVWPLRWFRFEASGLGAPVGHAVTNPEERAPVAVTVIATATAPAGTSQRLTTRTRMCPGPTTR
jgi:hypothetical protein